MYRRKETQYQKIARLRGALGVILLLVVLIGFYRIGRPQTAIITTPNTRGAEQETLNSTPERQYAIVFDAGSTGSRIHVFEFADSKGSNLITDHIMKRQPGLSDYVGSPENAANSLTTLIDYANEIVPEEYRHTTPMMLLATAGLRLLRPDAQEAIINRVREYLYLQGYNLVPDGVGIIEGNMEGVFSWVAINYMIGGLDGSKTYSVIDLGGSSVQQTYQVDKQVFDQAQGTESAKYFDVVNCLGKQYALYTHSYLSYGLMAQRTHALSVDDQVCVLGPGPHAPFQLQKNSEPLEVKVGPQGANFNKCSQMIRNTLNVTDSCGGVPGKGKCTFNGTWASTSMYPNVYYIASYFWDRAQQVGIIPATETTTYDVAPEAFATAASNICELTTGQALSKYPKLADVQDDLPFLCMDLTYCYQLLTSGLKLNPSSKVTIVKQIMFKGQPQEAAWALGAALDLLGKSGGT